MTKGQRRKQRNTQKKTQQLQYCIDKSMEMI